MRKIDSKDKLIELVGQYKNLIFSLALKMTGDYFAAEDITQETFVSAYEHLKEFDGKSEKAWLCRIASNKCIDWRREAARKTVAVADEDMENALYTDENEPFDNFYNKDVMERFRECCEQLQEPYRDVAVKHFIEGKTAKEIASLQQTGLKTIQTRIFRAKELLKKALRKEGFLNE